MYLIYNFLNAKLINSIYLKFWSVIRHVKFTSTFKFVVYKKYIIQNYIYSNKSMQMFERKYDIFVKILTS